jgi:hypothetical protein
LSFESTVTCRSTLNPHAERCYIFNGAFTLMGYENLEEAELYTKLLVKNAMQNGLLNNVLDEVLSVDFVSFESSTELPSLSVNITPQTDETIQAPSSKPIVYTRPPNDQSALLWILVIICTCTFLLYLAWIVRRRRMRYYELQRVQQEIGGINCNDGKPDTSWSQFVSSQPIRLNETILNREPNNIDRGHPRYNTVPSPERKYFAEYLIVADNHDLSPLYQGSYNTPSSSGMSSLLNETEALDPLVVANDSFNKHDGYESSYDSDQSSSSLYFEDQSNDSVGMRCKTKYSRKRMGSF